MLLIGSAAMQYRGIEEFQRPVKDYDFICYKNELLQLVSSLSKVHKLVSLQFSTNKGHCAVKFLVDGSIKVVEATLLDEDFGETYQSDLYIHDHWMNSIWYGDVDIMGIKISTKVVTPSFALLMKLSHRYKKDSVHFQKTRRDIIALRKLDYPEFKYFVKSPEFETALAFREKLTYTNQLPKLNVDKEKFFTDSVAYKYDHDTIHEAVKHLDKPAYQYYMQDDAQVMCSKDKFFDAPEIVRLYGVLEESYVLALERAVIPFGTSPERAFDIALEKVCTSITGGWFREYAWENYDRVHSMFHNSYVQKFTNALNAGMIKPFKENADVITN